MAGIPDTSLGATATSIEFQNRIYSLSKAPEKRARGDVKAIFKLLRGLDVAIFDDMDPSTAKEATLRLAASARLRRLKAGTAAFRQGDKGYSFFIILQGVMGVVIETDLTRKLDDTEFTALTTPSNCQCLAHLRAGRSFGELALMGNEDEVEMHELEEDIAKDLDDPQPKKKANSSAPKKGSQLARDRRRMATVFAKTDALLMVIDAADYRSCVLRSQQEALRRKVSTLKHLPMLRDWPINDVVEVSYFFHKRTYDQPDHVVQEEVFVVASGECDLVKLDYNYFDVPETDLPRNTQSNDDLVSLLTDQLSDAHSIVGGASRGDITEEFSRRPESRLSTSSAMSHASAASIAASSSGLSDNEDADRKSEHPNNVAAPRKKKVCVLSRGRRIGVLKPVAGSGANEINDYACMFGWGVRHARVHSKRSAYSYTRAYYPVTRGPTTIYFISPEDFLTHISPLTLSSYVALDNITFDTILHVDSASAVPHRRTKSGVDKLKKHIAPLLRGTRQWIDMAAAVVQAKAKPPAQRSFDDVDALVDFLDAALLPSSMQEADMSTSSSPTPPPLGALRRDSASSGSRRSVFGMSRHRLSSIHSMDRRINAKGRKSSVLSSRYNVTSDATLLSMEQAANTTSFYESLSFPQRRDFCGAARVTTLLPHTIVYAQHQPVKHLHVLLAGTVSLFARTCHGAPHLMGRPIKPGSQRHHKDTDTLLATIHPGECFGDVEMLSLLYAMSRSLLNVHESRHHHRKSQHFGDDFTEENDHKMPHKRVFPHLKQHKLPFPEVYTYTHSAVADTTVEVASVTLPELLDILDIDSDLLLSWARHAPVLPATAPHQTRRQHRKLSILSREHRRSHSRRSSQQSASSDAGGQTFGRSELARVNRELTQLLSKHFARVEAVDNVARLAIVHNDHQTHDCRRVHYPFPLHWPDDDEDDELRSQVDESGSLYDLSRTQQVGSMVSIHTHGQKTRRTSVVGGASVHRETMVDVMWCQLAYGGIMKLCSGSEPVVAQGTVPVGLYYILEGECRMEVHHVPHMESVHVEEKALEVAHQRRRATNAHSQSTDHHDALHAHGVLGHDDTPATHDTKNSSGAPPSASEQRMRSSGKTHELSILTSSQYFGDSSLFTRAPSPVSVTSKGRCRLLCFPRLMVLPLLAQSQWKGVLQAMKRNWQAKRNFHSDRVAEMSQFEARNVHVHYTALTHLDPATAMFPHTLAPPGADSHGNSPHHLNSLSPLSPRSARGVRAPHRPLSATRAQRAMSSDSSPRRRTRGHNRSRSAVGDAKHAAKHSPAGGRRRTLQQSAKEAIQHELTHGLAHHSRAFQRTSAARASSAKARRSVTSGDGGNHRRPSSSRPRRLSHKPSGLRHSSAGSRTGRSRGASAGNGDAKHTKEPHHRRSSVHSDVPLPTPRFSPSLLVPWRSDEGIDVAKVFPYCGIGIRPLPKSWLAAHPSITEHMSASAIERSFAPELTAALVSAAEDEELSDSSELSSSPKDEALLFSVLQGATALERWRFALSTVLTMLRALRRWVAYRKVTVWEPRSARGFSILDVPAEISERPSSAPSTLWRTRHGRPKRPHSGRIQRGRRSRGQSSSASDSESPSERSASPSSQRNEDNRDADPHSMSDEHPSQGAAAASNDQKDEASAAILRARRRLRARAKRERLAMRWKSEFGIDYDSDEEQPFAGTWWDKLVTKGGGFVSLGTGLRLVAPQQQFPPSASLEQIRLGPVAPTELSERFPKEVFSPPRGGWPESPPVSPIRVRPPRTAPTGGLRYNRSHDESPGPRTPFPTPRPISTPRQVVDVDRRAKQQWAAQTFPSRYPHLATVVKPLLENSGSHMAVMPSCFFTVLRPRSRIAPAFRRSEWLKQKEMRKKARLAAQVQHDNERFRAPPMRHPSTVSKGSPWVERSPYAPWKVSSELSGGGFRGMQPQVAAERLVHEITAAATREQRRQLRAQAIAARLDRGGTAGCGKRRRAGRRGRKPGKHSVASKISVSSQGNDVSQVARDRAPSQVSRTPNQRSRPARDYVPLDLRMSVERFTESLAAALDMEAYEPSLPAPDHVDDADDADDASSDRDTSGIADARSAPSTQRGGSADTDEFQLVRSLSHTGRISRRTSGVDTMAHREKEHPIAALHRRQSSRMAKAREDAADSTSRPLTSPAATLTPRPPSHVSPRPPSTASIASGGRTSALRRGTMPLPRSPVAPVGTALTRRRTVSPSVHELVASLQEFKAPPPESTASGGVGRQHTHDNPRLRAAVPGRLARVRTVDLYESLVDSPANSTPGSRPASADASSQRAASRASSGQRAVSRASSSGVQHVPHVSGAGLTEHSARPPPTPDPFERADSPAAVLGILSVVQRQHDVLVAGATAAGQDPPYPLPVRPQRWKTQRSANKRMGSTLTGRPATAPHSNVAYRVSFK